MSTGRDEVRGPDGLVRCPWSLSSPEYLAYYDTEWGWPVASVGGIFERLTLEAFQSGLSWATILRKRPAFRAAFDGFDADAVSRYTDDDVARLLGTLNLYLPTYEARLGADTYRLVRGNLQVLTDCFYGEALVPEALEVIHEHLLTLTRMLAFRSN